MARRKKKRKGARSGRKKKCRFCSRAGLEINYKDQKLMMRYISDRGKIVARRVSGNCARHQRELAKDIKIARFLALVPYVREHYR